MSDVDYLVEIEQADIRIRDLEGEVGRLRNVLQYIANSGKMGGAVVAGIAKDALETI